MTWLALRQFRAQAVTAAAALAAFAILLAVTGPHLASLYDTSGISGCHGGPESAANGPAASTCADVASSFLQQLVSGATYWDLYIASVMIILVAPAIIGLFWGAPLIAREFETGTRHLAWNQSITRTRWLAVKLGLTGLAAMGVTEALSLMQAWWAAPIGRAVGLGGSGSGIAMNEYSEAVFVTHGITPLGYAAFAFVLGAATGALIRRTLPAMAVTLVVFTAIQIAMPLAIRPHLFPPDRLVAVPFSSVSDIAYSYNTGGNIRFSADSLPGQPGAWILSSGAVNTAGHRVRVAPAACLPAIANNQVRTSMDCLDSHGIRVAVSYEPASRYWAFEWTETAIFGVLALGLAGFCFWQLSRRRS
jgi:hypothetical protein